MRDSETPQPDTNQTAHSRHIPRDDTAGSAVSFRIAVSRACGTTPIGLSPVRSASAVQTNSHRHPREKSRLVALREKDAAEVRIIRLIRATLDAAARA